MTVAARQSTTTPVAVSEAAVDEPWELPKGWRWERLSAVTQPVNRGNPASRHPTAFRYVDVSGVSGSRIVPREVATPDAPGRARQFLRAGDTLLSTARVYLKNIAFIPADDLADVASTAFCVLRPSDAICPRYLFHYVSSDQFVGRLLPFQRGNSPPAVLDEDVKARSIPLPSKATQQRIAGQIDSLFAEIDSAEAAFIDAQDGVATYRKSLIKAVVTGELTRRWRDANPPKETGLDLLARILAERRKQWQADPKNASRKYVEPISPGTTDLPKLPSSWVWATLAQIASLITSGSRGWGDRYSEVGPIFVRAQDIRSDYLVVEKTARVLSPKGSEGARTRVSVYDVLVTITGANVTKSALVERDIGEAYVSQHVGQIRLVDAKIAKYVYYWIIAEGCGRAQLRQAAYGAGKPGLNLGNLRDIWLPIPPLAEQMQICRVLEEKLPALADDLDLPRDPTQLRQAIFRAAFLGKLSQ